MVAYDVKSMNPVSALWATMCVNHHY